jgi:hypothetical protein
VTMYRLPIEISILGGGGEAGGPKARRNRVSFQIGPPMSAVGSL